MNKSVSVAAALLLVAAFPSIAKDWVATQGSFQRVSTNAATTNTMGMVFFMDVGNGKAQVTISGTNVAANTNFQFLVGGVPQAGFVGNVRQKANLTFRNFTGKNVQTLDFDPRGQVLTISNGKSNVLTLTLGTTGQPTNMSYHESVDLSAVGGSAGKAEVSYDQTRSNVIAFRVTLTGVPTGTNDVYVDGLFRGSIVVAAGKKAKLLLVSPYGANDRGLTFDPRGKVVDVLRGGVLQFTGTFRARANGVTQCPATASQAAMVSTGLDADASGEVRFITTEQCVRKFTVFVQNLDAGNYDLFVDGTNRAALTVSSNDASGLGQITFSTLPESGESLLSFDAEGKLIQLQQSTNVFFSGTGTPAALSGCGATQTTVPLLNQGLISAAHSNARSGLNEGCRQEFRVDLSSVPVGAYDLYVGGVLRGVINVASANTGTGGSIQFFNPFSLPAQNPLGFNPSGQLIEIRQDTNVILQRIFP